MLKQSGIRFLIRSWFPTKFELSFSQLTICMWPCSAFCIITILSVCLMGNLCRTYNQVILPRHPFVHPKAFFLVLFSIPTCALFSLCSADISSVKYSRWRKRWTDCPSHLRTAADSYCVFNALLFKLLVSLENTSGLQFFPSFWFLLYFKLYSSILVKQITVYQINIDYYMAL